MSSTQKTVRAMAVVPTSRPTKPMKRKTDDSVAHSTDAHSTDETVAHNTKKLKIKESLAHTPKETKIEPTKQPLTHAQKKELSMF